MGKTYYRNEVLYVVLENAYLHMTVVPEVGGKVLTLTKKDTGTQFFLEPTHEYRKAGLPYYGAEYGRFDPCGFEDCFPTIAPCDAPINPEQAQKPNAFPEHGEVWSIPWDYHVASEGGAMYLHVTGVQLAYEFSKKIRLDGPTVHMEYRVMNLADQPFAYIWAAQPLLEAPSGSRLLLGDEVETVFLDWTTDEALGQHGDYVPWPRLKSPQPINDAVISHSDRQESLKVYTDALTTGTCGYVRGDTGEILRMEFAPHQIPYLGILVWRESGAQKGRKNRSPRRAVALQPSKGRPDSLQEAYARKEHAELGAFEMAEWTLRMTLN